MTGARPGGHRTLLQLTVDEQVDTVTLERLASFYAESNAQLAQLVSRDQPESRLPTWLYNEHDDG